jgi:hypothetical protein
VESTIVGEGTVQFDIKFYVIVPGNMERIKMIINVELQKKYRKKYHLVTRGVFSCARMLSEQKHSEFTGDNYQEYAKDSGELAHKQINNAIKHGILNVEKPTEKDIKIIKGIFQKSRKLVKQRLIKENKFSF